MVLNDLYYRKCCGIVVVMSWSDISFICTLLLFQVVAAVIAYRYRNQFDPDDKAASAIISRHHSNHVYWYGKKKCILYIPSWCKLKPHHYTHMQSHHNNSFFKSVSCWCKIDTWWHVSILVKEFSIPQVLSGEPSSADTVPDLAQSTFHQFAAQKKF